MTDLEKIEAKLDENNALLRRLLQQMERPQAADAQGLTPMQHISIRDEAMQIHLNGWPEKRRRRRKS